MLNLLSYPKMPTLLGAIVIILALSFITSVALRNSKVNLEEPTVETTLVEEILNISDLPNFDAYTNTQDKKTAFFDFLIEYVEAENNRILDDREKVLALWDVVRRNLELSEAESDVMEGLVIKYRLGDSTLGSRALVQELLLRVDMIPASLVLAQAANESAWGTSRFAKEGNNIFGQWCFDEGCGLIPERRRVDAAHEVRAYTSVEASVRSYFRNINTNAAYASLREMRADMRESDRPLDAYVLAHGLIAYSQRGHIYVNEIHDIIRQNDLQRLDRS